MKQYLGNEEILTVFQLETKTPAGEAMVEINFESGKKETMPKKRLELLNSVEISDATSTNLTLKAHVASVLYGVLHEYGVKMGEVNGISDGMVDLVNNGFSKATNFLWKTEDREELPLNSVNEVLIANAKPTTTE